MVDGFGHTYDTLQSLLTLTVQVLARQLWSSSAYQIATNGESMVHECSSDSHKLRAWDC